MERPGTEETPSPWRRAVRSKAVHGIVLVLAVAVLAARWLGTDGRLEAARDRFGILSTVVTVPAHAVIAISPLPSEVIAFANGALWGFWTGTFLSWLGWMLAALLHYGLVRRAARDLDVESVMGRAPRWLRRWPAHHPLFLIAGRWVPYGPQMVCTVAGVYRVPLRRFTWCAAVGILPVALFFSALATGLTAR